MSAIFALGLIGAGTNNSKVAQNLRALASYYQAKDTADQLFVVRIAQGLVHMGKVSKSPHLIICSSFSLGPPWTEPIALREILVLKRITGRSADGAVGCNRYEDIHHGQVPLLLVLPHSVHLSSHADHA